MSRIPHPMRLFAKAWPTEGITELQATRARLTLLFAERDVLVRQRNVLRQACRKIVEHCDQQRHGRFASNATRIDVGAILTLALEAIAAAKGT